MKRIKIIGVVLTMLGVTSVALAQSEIRKEVNVEIENGEHIMTITTTDKDGKINVEEYKGEEAKKKIHEMHENVPEGTVTEKRIVKDVIDKDGNHMIIKKSCDNGKYSRRNVWIEESKMSEEEKEAFHAKMEEFHESLSEEEKKMMHHYKMRKHHELPEIHRKMMEMHEDLPAGQAGMDIQIDEENGKLTIKIDGEEQVIDISDAEGMEEGEHKMIFISDDKDEDGVEMKKEIIIITRNVRIEDDKSLKNNLKGVDFKTYPNPNNGDFNIELKLDSKKDTYFSIKDLNGKEIHKGKIEVDKKGVYTQPVKMSDMPKGTYLIQVTQGKKAATKKVIIE